MNDNTTIQRTLPNLARAINHEHQSALDHGTRAVAHAQACGQLLIEAKVQVAHGEWLDWLKANCSGISERTAQGYMRLARELPKLDSAKAQRVADLPLRDALAAIADERTELEKARAFDIEGE